MSAASARSDPLLSEGTVGSRPRSALSLGPARRDTYEALRQSLMEIRSGGFPEVMAKARSGLSPGGAGASPASAASSWPPAADSVQSPGGGTMPLGASAAEELEMLLSAPQQERDAERCAELCRNLQLFRRLAPGQAAALLRAGEPLRVPAGETLYRTGDPLGHVYLVLTGWIALEQEEVRGNKALVQSFHDGRAFGDGWNPGEDGRVATQRRRSTAVVQEDAWLLRWDTAQYQIATCVSSGRLQAGVALLGRQPWLFPCNEHQMSVLAALLEPRTTFHGACVVRVGDHVHACHIVARGTCLLKVRTPSGTGEEESSLVARELRAGACFGHGALLARGANCSYAARAAVRAETWVVELYLLEGLPFAETLPDSTLEKVTSELEVEQAYDPILEDGREAIDRDAKWRRKKRQVLDEVRRCSPSCTVLGPRTGPGAAYVGRQPTRQQRPQSAASSAGRPPWRPAWPHQGPARGVEGERQPVRVRKSASCGGSLQDGIGRASMVKLMSRPS